MHHRRSTARYSGYDDRRHHSGVNGGPIYNLSYTDSGAPSYWPSDLMNIKFLHIAGR